METKTKSKSASATVTKGSKSTDSKPGSNGKSSNGQNQNRSTQNQESVMKEEGLLNTLFLDSLKDIYWAEKSLTKALPKMQKAATTPELKKAFADHLEVTKEQISRLEEVFELLDKKAQSKKCEAMAGLTKEAEELIEGTDPGTMTRDVALIMAAQKIEHYEIATYGSLAQLARTIGNTEVADLLNETLAEEKEADQLLTSIAENHINSEAEAE